MSAYTDDAYKILGVSPDATEKEIKTAYRKLALLHHPDRQTDPKLRDISSNKFAAIANAYEILTDEYLRAEYNNKRRSASNDSHNNNPNNKTKSSTSNVPRKSSSNAPNHRPEPFRYHFSDPYEVFKRDFREQFGIDYPGAKYDWIDFDEPIVPPQNKNNATKMLTNGNTTQNKIKGIQEQSTDISENKDSPKKKGGFNPFRRKQLSPTDPIVNDRQLVVAKGKNDLAVTNQNISNSTALVVAEKRNNRPISMDVQTSKVGNVTTTKTTITRPDGSTETMTMKTGLPGKAPDKTPKSSSVPRLTNGHTGSSSTSPPPRLLTNSTNAPKLRLPSTTTTTTTTRSTTDGRTTQRLLTNEAAATNKVKLLGWGGGSKQ
jgi:curved DNA-binding protein CbpA